MRIFLTGHTGFKGSWFTLLASAAGHEVHGFSLPPVANGIFETANVRELCASHREADIRDAEALGAAIEGAEPEAVIHMAAQPLVRRSYHEPEYTFEVNVAGTLNLLASASRCQTLNRIMVITSDKVYRNTGLTTGYPEGAALGGADPYSASKAMAELLVESWARSFPRSGLSIATARAGNVIGGGDQSEDRLLPDMVRAFESGEPAVLRFPSAIRPWQHVLDVSAGYLDLLQAMPSFQSPSAWNFGPGPQTPVTVGEIAEIAASKWGKRARVTVAGGEHPPEAAVLTLDSTKSRDYLGWETLLSCDEAVDWTIEWELAVRAGVLPRDAAHDQVNRFRVRKASRAPFEPLPPDTSDA